MSGLFKRHNTASDSISCHQCQLPTIVNVMSSDIMTIFIYRLPRLCRKHSPDRPLSSSSDGAGTGIGIRQLPTAHPGGRHVCCRYRVDRPDVVSTTDQRNCRRQRPKTSTWLHWNAADEKVAAAACVFGAWQLGLEEGDCCDVRQMSTASPKT